MLSRYVLIYLVSATRGGIMRGRILAILETQPMNAHQLAKTLKVDYKTIMHHLHVLEQNGAIAVINKGSYGAVYHHSAGMEALRAEFHAMWKE